MSDEQNTPKPRARSKRKIIALATGTALIAGSAFGVHAFANSKTYSHMQLAASDGGGWHSSARHRRHGGGFERMSEADMERKVTRMVKHAAIEIDATPEQEEKINALVTALAKDLMPLRGEMHEMGQEIQSLFMADTIDRTAIEAMRAERLAEMDRISESVFTAAADVAEVLTPEQRESLNERISQFKSYRGGRRGGWWKHH